MWDYRNISTLSTLVIGPAPVDLIAVVVNTAVAAAIVAVFDGTNATTTNLRPIASIDASATGNFFYGNHCKNGLTVTLSGGTANVTVIYDPHPEY